MAKNLIRFSELRIGEDIEIQCTGICQIVKEIVLAYVTKEEERNGTESLFENKKKYRYYLFVSGGDFVITRLLNHMYWH